MGAPAQGQWQLKAEAVKAAGSINPLGSEVRLLMAAMPAEFMETDLLLPSWDI